MESYSYESAPLERQVAGPAEALSKCVQHELAQRCRLRHLVFRFREGLDPVSRRLVWKSILLGPGESIETNQVAPSGPDLKDLSSAALHGSASTPSAERSGGWENSSVERFIAEGILDEVNQRVIQSDVERTRSSLPLFKDPLMRDVIERMLTFFCKQKRMKYKQGLNEIIAPFIFAANSGSFSTKEAFECFAAFVTRYLPMYTDDEMFTLQVYFRLFKQLLIYHDPWLSHFLEFHGVLPELYVTPWFLTLFGSKMQINLLLCLWDYYIVEEDTAFFCFLAVTLLFRNRSMLLETELSQLPETLARITIKSYQELREVWKIARQIRENTPASFHAHMVTAQNFAQHGCDNEIIENPDDSLQILPREILRHCYATWADSLDKDELPCQRYQANTWKGRWKLLVLDVRSRKDFETGRVPPAISIDVLSDDRWREKTIDLAAATNPRVHVDFRSGSSAGWQDETESSGTLLSSDSDLSGCSACRRRPNSNLEDCNPSSNASDFASASAPTVATRISLEVLAPTSKRRASVSLQGASPTARRLVAGADTSPTDREVAQLAAGGTENLETSVIASHRHSAYCSRIPAYHICLLAKDSTPDQLRLRSFLYHTLTQELWLRWVSVACGGYERLHNVALEAGVELVDHQSNVCELCRGWRRTRGGAYTYRLARPLTTTFRRSQRVRNGAGAAEVLSSRRLFGYRPRRTADATPRGSGAFEVDSSCHYLTSPCSRPRFSAIALNGDDFSSPRLASATRSKRSMSRLVHGLSSSESHQEPMDGYPQNCGGTSITDPEVLSTCLVETPEPLPTVAVLGSSPPSSQYPESQPSKSFWRYRQRRAGTDVFLQEARRSKSSHSTHKDSPCTDTSSGFPEIPTAADAVSTRRGLMARDFWSSTVRNPLRRTLPGTPSKKKSKHLVDFHDFPASNESSEAVAAVAAVKPEAREYPTFPVLATPPASSMANVPGLSLQFLKRNNANSTPATHDRHHQVRATPAGDPCPGLQEHTLKPQLSPRDQPFTRRGTASLRRSTGGNHSSTWLLEPPEQQSNTRADSWLQRRRFSVTDAHLSTCTVLAQDSLDTSVAVARTTRKPRRRSSTTPPAWDLQSGGVDETTTGSEATEGSCQDGRDDGDAMLLLSSYPSVRLARPRDSSEFGRSSDVVVSCRGRLATALLRHFVSDVSMRDLWRMLLPDSCLGGGLDAASSPSARLRFTSECFISSLKLSRTAQAAAHEAVLREVRRPVVCFPPAITNGRRTDDCGAPASSQRTWNTPIEGNLGRNPEGKLEGRSASAPLAPWCTRNSAVLRVMLPREAVVLPTSIPREPIYGSDEGSSVVCADVPMDSSELAATLSEQRIQSLCYLIPSSDIPCHLLLSSRRLVLLARDYKVPLVVAEGLSDSDGHSLAESRMSGVQWRSPMTTCTPFSSDGTVTDSSRARAGRSCGSKQFASMEAAPRGVAAGAAASREALKQISAFFFGDNNDPRDKNRAQHGSSTTAVDNCNDSQTLWLQGVSSTSSHRNMMGTDSWNSSSDSSEMALDHARGSVEIVPEGNFASPSWSTEKQLSTTDIWPGSGDPVFASGASLPSQHDQPLARIYALYNLGSIAKITSRRNHADCLYFYFFDESPPRDSESTKDSHAPLPSKNEGILPLVPTLSLGDSTNQVVESDSTNITRKTAARQSKRSSRSVGLCLRFMCKQDAANCLATIKELYSQAKDVKCAERQANGGCYTQAGRPEA